MTDYLSAALQKLNAAEGDVLDYVIKEDDIVILINKGIKGVRKHTIPLDTLTDSPLDAVEYEEPPIVIEDEPAELPEVETTDFSELSRVELQALAKEAGIPANLSSDAIVAALLEEEE